LDENLPKPEPLILPRGVRFPFKYEIPGNQTEVLERIAAAQITTGYTLLQAEGKPFGGYIEANVHAPNIFDVFSKLTIALMPEAAAPLIGIKDEEPVFGPSTYRALALGVFEPYVDLLQNDGFLEFGLIHQSEFAFEEIFVGSPKYFKIWTNNVEAAESALQASGIPKCEELEFIDQYPMVSLSIKTDGKASWPGPFYAIQEQFENLPEPPAPDNE
jgi:hypothetical protein